MLDNIDLRADAPRNCMVVAQHFEPGPWHPRAR